MTLIAPADMKAEFAKDFASDDDAALQRAIDRAYRQCGDAWGELVNDGALYLAAHLRIIAKRGATGASGQVQSKRVGEISVTYAATMPKLDAGSLGTTAYGYEFLRMLYTLPDARFAFDPSDDYFDGIPDPALPIGDCDGH